MPSPRCCRRPLEPSAATARLRIAVVDMGTGLPTFGAGWFGVRARHGDVEGEYALFMPMSTEQATIGGRETFGEPKKIAQLVARPRRATRLTATGGPDGLDDRRGGRHPRAGAARLRDRQARLLLQAPARPVGRGTRGRPRPRLLPPPRDGPGGPSGDGGVQAARGAPRPDRRLPDRARSSPSSTPRSPRPRRGRSSSGCRPSGWCRSCISATTT